MVSLAERNVSESRQVVGTLSKQEGRDYDLKETQSDEGRQKDTGASRADYWLCLFGGPSSSIDICNNTNLGTGLMKKSMNQ